jgi:hypothetical protein
LKLALLLSRLLLERLLHLLHVRHIGQDRLLVRIANLLPNGRGDRQHG